MEVTCTKGRITDKLVVCHLFIVGKCTNGTDAPVRTLTKAPGGGKKYFVEDQQLS
jgi:hypothetical protein